MNNSHDDRDDEFSAPKTEPSGGGGDDGNAPRRPTAVGSGGSDDEFEDALRALRRLDLENAANEIGDSELQSWPISQITFVKIEGVRRFPPRAPWSTAARDDQTNSPPRSVYLMEDAITGLSSQKAYIAYLVCGNKDGVDFYTGISLQAIPENAGESQSAICYNIQKSILQSVYIDIDIQAESLSAEIIRSKIDPMSGYVGIVSGYPSVENFSGSHVQVTPIERIANEMRGFEFGILLLAAPVPSKMISDEEYIVLDQIQRAEEATEKMDRVRYYLELQNAYLKHIQLGQAIGHWLVGAYFFAPEENAFCRLRAILEAIYANDRGRLAPMRTHVIPGLRKHLLDFGLLRNTRSEPTVHNLIQYLFLTAQNSRMLSAYMHLPKGNLPGFKVGAGS